MKRHEISIKKCTLHSICQKYCRKLELPELPMFRIRAYLAFHARMVAHLMISMAILLLLCDTSGKATMSLQIASPHWHEIISVHEQNHLSRVSVESMSFFVAYVQVQVGKFSVQWRASVPSLWQGQQKIPYFEQKSLGWIPAGRHKAIFLKTVPHSANWKGSVSSAVVEPDFETNDYVSLCLSVSACAFVCLSLPSRPRSCLMLVHSYLLNSHIQWLHVSNHLWAQDLRRNTASLGFGGTHSTA